MVMHQSRAAFWTCFSLLAQPPQTRANAAMAVASRINLNKEPLTSVSMPLLSSSERVQSALSPCGYSHAFSEFWQAESITSYRTPIISQGFGCQGHSQCLIKTA